MKPIVSSCRAVPAAALTLLLLCACGDEGPAGVSGEPRIEFSVARVDLGGERTAEALLRNTGTRAAAPVVLAAGPIRDEAEATIAGSVGVEPSTVDRLEAGESVTVHLAVDLLDELPGGEYHASVEARVGESSDLRSALELRFSVESGPPGNGNGGAGIVIAAGPDRPRQGDVARYQVRTDAGEAVDDSLVEWAVRPASAGFFGDEGVFVGYEPGPALLVARLDDESDSLAVTIEPRGLTGSFQEVGRGAIRHRYTSDLWVYGSHAYTGTWGSRSFEGRTFRGNTLYTWDIRDPATPVLVDSLEVDAGTVNDVKVRADGQLAVITHEHSSDQLNGVTILDLSDPAHPETIARYTQGLESGVHNAWIDGRWLYVVADGSAGLRIVDISDPGSPTQVASFYAGSSFLHDVYVRDGLAFLTHWNAGLIVLDVGNGVAGGSPENPVEVSRIRTEGGQTHNAWYWPEGGYAFVGEENPAKPGVMHVVDLRTLAEPREVATFAVPGDTPHNFWLDEDRGILYAAWYGQGIRAIDVTGELLGDLDRQGREIAALRYAGLGCGETETCTWAPQLHGGLVYLSDLDLGLVVVEPRF